MLALLLFCALGLACALRTAYVALTLVLGWGARIAGALARGIGACGLFVFGLVRDRAEDARDATVGALRRAHRVLRILWRRRRMIGWLMAGAAGAYLGGAYVLDLYGRRGVVGDYDAIVVAGCRVMPSGRPSPALARRVEHAVELYREGIAPKLVFTGGVGAAEPSEAEASARLAEQLGVPREAMVLEDRSTSTEENARYAAALVGDDARIVVVSSAYHVFRCERVFARHFADARGSGSIEQMSPRVRGAIREVTALSAYAVLGRL